MKTVGEQIKYIRKQKGLSQRKLAELIGIKKSTLWRIETNQASVKSDYVYALCEALECDPNELFGFKKWANSKNYIQ